MDLLDLTNEHTVAASRRMLVEYEAAAVQRLDPLDSSLEEYFDSVTTFHGHAIKLKVIRPKPQVLGSTKAPLILLIHGGGFVAGSIHQLTRPGRDFAQQFGAVVILNTYRLGPEWPFPTQFEDCWELILWLAVHATERFGAYPEQGFIVGGASAGGNLAAVLAQQALERGLSPPITGSFITVPLLLLEDNVPERFKGKWTSNETNTPFPSVHKSARTEWKIRMRLDTASPLFSPFNVSPQKLQGLSRTYIQVGGLDPVRDDGVIYESLLREMHVETRIDNYPDLEHMTWSIFADETYPKELGPNTMAAMAWLLRRD